MGSVSEGLGSVSEGLVPITVPARVQVPQGKITEGPEGPGLARSDLQPMNNCYNQSLFDRLIKHCEIIWPHHGYSYGNQLSRCNMFSFYIPPALRPLQWFFLYSSLVLGSMECLASKEDRLREGGLTFPICNAHHMPHDHEMNDIL